MINKIENKKENYIKKYVLSCIIVFIALVFTFPFIFSNHNTDSDAVEVEQVQNIRYDSIPGIYYATADENVGTADVFNKAKGGLLYIGNGSSHTMSGGRLRGNTAAYGGAIYVAKGGTFTMNDGAILDNQALYGGAIYVANGGRCYLHGGRIANNAAIDAAAVYVEDGGFLEITDCLIEDNVGFDSEYTFTIEFNSNKPTGTIGEVDGSTQSVTAIYNVFCKLTHNKYSLTGYTFAGWATSVDGKVIYADGIMLTKSQINEIYNEVGQGGIKTLYAKWTAKTYTIEFNGNGATSGTTASVTATYDSTCTLTSNGFAKTGYTFAGWATNVNGSVVHANGEALTVAQVNTYYNEVGNGGTKTLYAEWTTNIYTITYKDQGNVAFSGTHASGYPTTHTYGTATTLKSASKTGYTFKGWYTNSSCTGSAVTSLGATTYTNNIILYAKWEIAVVVNYYVDGALAKTVRSFTFNLSDAPESANDYRECCGYFTDVNMTKGIENGTNLGTSGTYNVYTRTATLDKLRFYYQDTLQCYTVGKKDTSISGTVVIPRMYNDGTNGLKNVKFYPSDDDYGAFRDAVNLNYVYLPNTITNIPAKTFRNTGIQSTVMPEGVTNIGYRAFSGCNLTSIYLPKTLQSVGYAVFNDVTNLAIHYGGTVKDWCGMTFGSSGMAAWIHDQGNKTWKLYINDTVIDTLVIPGTVSTVNYNAFYGCNITGLSIENGVTTIEGRAFAYTGLTKAFIPSSVSTINDGSVDGPFYKCSSDLHIYCQATSKPSGWDDKWDEIGTSRCTVTWGSTPQFYTITFTSPIKMGYVSHSSIVVLGGSVISVSDNTLNCDGVTVDATPLSGYEFSRWSGVSNGMTVTENMTIYAVFQKSNYTQ